MLGNVELRDSGSRNYAIRNPAHRYFTKPTALPVIRLRDQITSDPDSVNWTYGPTLPPYEDRLIT